MSHYGATETEYLHLEDPGMCSYNAKRCLRCCCSWNVYWKVVTCFFVIIVYLAIGATVFMVVESPYERKERREVDRERHRARAAIQNITEQLVNITTSCGGDVNVSRLVEKLTHHAKSLERSQMKDPYWDNYAAAIFFATTVITTIGEHKYTCKFCSYTKSNPNMTSKWLVVSG